MNEKNNWFYAWLRTKEIRENKESSPTVLSPLDEQDRLFVYIANGYHGKATGRFDRLVKHIELSRHFANKYMSKLPIDDGIWHFMIGFCSALELIEYAAKKK